MQPSCDNFHATSNCNCFLSKFTLLHQIFGVLYFSLVELRIFLACSMFPSSFSNFAWAKKIFSLFGSLKLASCRIFLASFICFPCHFLFACISQNISSFPHSAIAFSRILSISFPFLLYFFSNSIAFSHSDFLPLK